MTANQIRQKYIEYFKDKRHADIGSASLVPQEDSTLLFVNSGMFPLVPYLLGSQEHPAGKRLVNSQKCFRAEDIDEVGDNRHNTFFEMLGNWSLGDYYKEEQLNWYFDFLVNELGVDINRLYQTVYAGDDQVPKDRDSVKIVKEIYDKYGIEAEEGPETTGDGDLGPGEEIDFKKEKIFAYKDKNWWQRGDAVGELGGPDSETFYDTGKKHNKKFGPHCHPNCPCGRFIEVGNSVFMAYQKSVGGWDELQHKNVDFGGGLERTAMITEDKDNIFETSLFMNIIGKLEEVSGKKYSTDILDEEGEQCPKKTMLMRSFEVIADHLKAAVFIMGDKMGVGPSNTDQGYIVRRLIRRAIRYGRQLNIETNGWAEEIAKIVINDYKDVYPELEESKGFILAGLKDESEKFAKTLERGLKEFYKIEGDISGKEAFDLYQTYGFPIEMTDEMACEQSKKVDKAGFYKHLKEHQEKSRQASVGKFKGGLADHSEETTRLHTATHLLLAALRQVLGDHVEQKGSNITEKRLRFDFNHGEKLTDDQKAEVERLVNQAIDKDLPVSCQEMPLTEAKKRGAIGVFDSKYDENNVRVYTVGDNEEVVSRELCGGPHVESTGELGRFRIKKEMSSSAGIRRIKAVLENKS